MNHDMTGVLCVALQYNRPPHEWGDLQLQLSYDDYDGTLSVHVMQARALKPKDRNGLSDPFVKCYLLPGRMYVHRACHAASTVLL